MTNHSKPTQHPIVGVGASAGGIEALEGFFRGIPAQSGLAYVIVTHLSPDRESLLPQVLSRFTSMPVVALTDDDVIEVDHVYVLSNDALVGVRHGRFQVTQSTSREPKPIDIFFSSLAADLGECAAGVVLSGGDGDGTLGLKAIKERGGLTLAQVSGEYGPRHPDMPDSAISAGFVDLAIPVTEMGPRLAEFARSLAVIQGLLDAPNEAVGDEEVRALLPEIYAILRSQIGHDFSGYKKRTFVRRVQRRMQITQATDASNYLELLRMRPHEVGLLFRDLLINVTNFFRDAAAFQGLADAVIPRLFEGKSAEDAVRIWVPGCATGEEVYSIAILLSEHLATRTVLPRVQVFATDIDEHALSVARAARYPAAMLDSVSAERRERFFTREGGSYVLNKDVRDLCVFSPHSVIRDPPFSKIDLVSCRNLLIYFGAEIQGQVIPTFHYALRPEGFLFLGSAENVSQFEELFAPVDKHHRIFRRRSVTTPNVPLPIKLGGARAVPADLPSRRSPLNGASLRQAVDNQVLERHAPAHVVVNHDGEVMYFSARTGKYLEVPAGAPTRQLLTLARKDLRLDLRAVLREAQESGRTMERPGLSVELEDGRVQLLNVLIEPLGERSGNEALFLVAFVDQGPVLAREDAMQRVQNRSTQQTERELRDTRDRLQSLIEEYETSLEELKSANEELVSVNEELQSTNEELEASKEELQSVNEELHTVNSELSGKIEDLDQANNDLINLFEATDVATVFLDKLLVIRSFTPAVAKVLNIRPGDLGRPVTDLTSRVSLAGLAGEIADVFKTQRTLERQAASEDQSTHFLIRIAPYVDASKRQEGVVVTFLDVTTLVRAEERQRLLVRELHHRTRNLLGVVQALAVRTLSADPKLHDFDLRLSALSRAQSLITGAVQREIDLAEMIRLELEAVGAPADRYTLSGPSAKLGFDLIQTMSLALHELTTNALKHGAFSANGGKLDVAWTVEEQGDHCVLRLQWIESGVAMATLSPGSGFGRELIETALVHSHDAKSSLRFTPDGVHCEIEVVYPARSSLIEGRNT